MSLRVDTELGAHRRRVADLLAAAVDLHDAVVAYALRQILVGRPDADPLGARVGSGEPRGGGERVIGLELGHRPYRDAHARERFLERMELRQQRGLDAVAGLVAGPQAVAERLDDVIGRDADVRGAFLDHLQHGVEHADDGAEGQVLALAEAAQAVEVSEQLVRAIDEVNDHADLRLLVALWGRKNIPTNQAAPRRRPLQPLRRLWQEPDAGQHESHS